ncbi:MAG: ATP-binding cassette domain-containing protein [Candidatus Electryoneaceae bacterium]|nr:ATP-binding cassette domain-containing protein [Candidatus Electryoneaceae bacterium]
MNDQAMPDHPVLVRADNLVKHYKDRKRGVVEAVRGISFESCAGEIFGLLGPNGAGKTTTLRILATILKSTSGTASIAGHDVVSDPDGVRRSLGFMSGDTGLYARLNAGEMVAYFGRLYGLEGDELNRRVEETAEQLDMHDFFNRRCGKLSTGQKQKVSIARTIVHNPPVLILDEPTAGLDVLASRNIVSFVRNARQDGKCIILSTHDMGEAERMCDRIGIIHNGLLVAVDTKEGLFKRYDATDLETVFLRAVGINEVEIGA